MNVIFSPESMRMQMARKHKINWKTIFNKRGEGGVEGFPGHESGLRMKGKCVIAVKSGPLLMKALTHLRRAQSAAVFCSSFRAHGSYDGLCGPLQTRIPRETTTVPLVPYSIQE